MLDDLQWGDETFLDLVESTGLLAGAPLLLLCMARPELLERRASWPGSLRLEPLPPDAAETLIGRALPDHLRERIARAAGGNPLFITEMLALSTNGGELEVPPTLRALLTARLDQLAPQERSVLERGSVEGEIFHRGAVQALAPEEPEVLPRLAALVRHELIRPDRPQFPGEDGFRFRHLLIRDTAYDTLPKSIRADLHRRFADWLESKATLVELDEVAGYHLEQAARYEAELGQPDAALMLRAGDRLIDAGRRALDRDVTRAAFGLIERGLALTRPLRYDLYSEFDLARSRMQDPARAAAICADAAALAADAGDETGQTLARAMTVFYRLMVEPGPPDELERLLLEVRPQLEAGGDHAGLAHVWWALGFGVANSRGRPDDWANASLEAYRHSRLSGRAATPPPDLGAALCVGSRAADVALEIVDRQLADAPSMWLQLNRCWLLAMLGRAQVRRLGEEAYARLREQEDALWGEWILAEISSLEGDHEDAVDRLRTLCEWIESKQQFAYLPYYVARVARSLALLGRFDEAEQWAHRASASSDAYESDNVWRGALARVHTARSEFGEAERLAREGVEVLDETQSLVEKAYALWDLAEVLAAASRADEAASAFEQALDRAGEKKNVALAAQIQRRWDELARGWS